MTKTKKVLHITPAGEAVYPWLNKYDDKPIKGKPQKPAFKTGVRYAANNPAWLKLKALIDGLVDESFAKAVEENPKKKKIIVKAYPYKEEVDAQGEETGTVVVNFKQAAFIPAKKEGDPPTAISIAVYDTKGNRIPKDVPVYGGSTIKVSFSTRPYLMDSSNSAGVSLDLAAVQVLNLVAASERSAASYGFGEEDGFEVETNDISAPVDAPALDNETDPTLF